MSSCSLCHRSSSSSSISPLNAVSISDQLNKLTIFPTSILSKMVSYFSIFDCVALIYTSTNLKDPDAVRALKLSAVRHLKKEYFAYRKFYILTDIHTPSNSITISNEEDKDNLRDIKEKVLNGPLVMLKHIQFFKDLIELSINKTSATSLWIHGKDITRLPSDLMLSNLKTVSLTRLRLRTSIPTWVFLLPKLKTLNLNNLGITTLPTIPSAISHCSNLETLNLSNNQDNCENANRMQELPIALSRLPKLTCLLIDSHHLTSIPSGLCEFNKLTHLYMSNNPLLGNLPDNFSNLRALNRLFIKNIGLTKWPQALLELKQIRDLAITDNKIKDVPEIIYVWLHQLESLYCANNPWSPEALNLLKALDGKPLENVEGSTEGRCRFVYYEG